MSYTWPSVRPDLSKPVIKNLGPSLARAPSLKCKKAKPRPGQCVLQAKKSGPSPPMGKTGPGWVGLGRVSPTGQGFSWPGILQGEVALDE